MLQVFYLAVGGAYGWYEWKFGGRDREGIEIGWWSPRQHVAALDVIIAATAVLG